MYYNSFIPVPVVEVTYLRQTSDRWSLITGWHRLLGDKKNKFANTPHNELSYSQNAHRKLARNEKRIAVIRRVKM